MPLDRLKQLVKGKRILLFGPPGGGKGARSEDLQELGLIPVASGVALRAKVRDGSQVCDGSQVRDEPESALGLRIREYMQRGALVPDDIVVPVVLEYLQQPQCRQQGYLLDGFPRTRSQCELLFSHEDIDLVLHLEVPRAFLIFGVIGCNRTGCVECGSGFSDFDPPREADRCDHCGGQLRQRVDDTEATITRRLAVYAEQTLAFLQDLEAKGIVKRLPITVPQDQAVDERFLLKLNGKVYFTEDEGDKLRLLNREGMRRRLYRLLEEHLG